MNTRNTLLVLAAALLVAACGQGSGIVTPDTGPRLDGIGTMGSGNSDGSTGTLPTDTMMTASGILTMGSGN